MKHPDDFGAEFIEEAAAGCRGGMNSDWHIESVDARYLANQEIRARAIVP